MTSALIGNPIPLVSSKTGFPKAVPVGVMRVVGRAIRHAWDLIEQEPHAHLVAPAPGAPPEDRYTDAICNILDQMLMMEASPVAGFNSEYFDCVCRSESVVNYNGSHLNKQPDLIVRMADSPLVEARRLVGVFIESKIVSMSQAVTKYTSDGLIRFVRGDYGWTMQAGMMLAYQRAKHRPLSSLKHQLAKESQLVCRKLDGEFLHAQPEFYPLTGVSVHDRNWHYASGEEPGPIQVWHMWDLSIPGNVGA